MSQQPSVADLLKIIGIARQVLDALPPAAVNMPPEAKAALTQFYDLSDYHGIAPDSAPHIPDTGL